MTLDYRNDYWKRKELSTTSQLKTERLVSNHNARVD